MRCDHQIEQVNSVSNVEMIANALSSKLMLPAQWVCALLGNDVKAFTARRPVGLCDMSLVGRLTLLRLIC